ncbi:MAG TPA: hypothetical protein VK914_02520 [bacterium]|nr:hypothetical protein [bacterium]
MKGCANCGKAIADAADRCPHCGMVDGARITSVTSEHDEPLGYQRSPMVQALIVALLVLLVVVAVAWICE